MVRARGGIVDRAAAAFLDARGKYLSCARWERGASSVAMSDLTQWHRTARVFLARLLMVHGEDAPEVLRRMADELEWLAEAERREREQH